MSTRSQIQFGQKDSKGFHKTAQVYHHYDGYPENRLLDILKAVTTAWGVYETENGYSYRIKDTYPSDLAAFYIIANKTSAGNVEIDEHLHSDIEYLYQVWQDNSGVMNVTIYTTHQSENEEYDKKKFELFWNDPSLENMRIEADGELEDLIVKYNGEK